MEGLQGFGWGIALSAFVWSSVVVLVMRKAFLDGHIAGQKAMGAVDPDDVVE